MRPNSFILSRFADFLLVLMFGGQAVSNLI
jgi:hypothetical protein